MNLRTKLKKRKNNKTMNGKLNLTNSDFNKSWHLQVLQKCQKWKLNENLSHRTWSQSIHQKSKTGSKKLKFNYPISTLTNCAKRSSNHKADRKQKSRQWEWIGTRRHIQGLESLKTSQTIWTWSFKISFIAKIIRLSQQKKSQRMIGEDSLINLSHTKLLSKMIPK